MDDNIYVLYNKKYAPYTFCIDTERCGEPVANIMPDPAEVSSYDNFLTRLTSGKSITESLPISALYPVKNDNGFEIYLLDMNCEEIYYLAERPFIISEFYSDENNYDVINLHCTYETFSDTGGSPVNTIEKTVVLRPGDWSMIVRMFKNTRNVQSVNIPTTGAESRTLTSYSFDKLAYTYRISLFLVDDKTYVDQDTGNNLTERRCTQLPEEVNEYMKNAVFGE
jgi:hypothetical protein